MKPYYEQDGITIYHGDCREVLPQLDRVDVVITDPPYGEDVHNKQRRQTFAADRAKFNADYIRSHDLGFCALSPELRRFVSCSIARVCTRWSLVFCNVEMVSQWREDLESHGFEYVRTGAWIKLNATPQFTGDRPASGFEAIVITHPKGRKKWNGGGLPAVWSYPIVLPRDHKTARFHTAQKPIALVGRLIEQFTNEGETILDPFMGSGTTLRAALEAGRRAIGIEIEEKYCEIAVDRMAQKVLFT